MMLSLAVHLTSLYAPDPASFVRPWSADSQMTRTDQMMYEYACHEANYSMGYILSGARFAERSQGR